jgi:hypothetical protein
MKIVLLLLWLTVSVVGQTKNDNGAAEQDRTHNAHPAKTASVDNQKTLPSQVFVTNQQLTTEHQSKADISAEDIEIQRQLTKFTKYLVWVGLLQAVVLASQAVLFFQQKKIMEEHKTKFEDLAKAANSNAQAAILQVGAMQKQITEMSAQTDVLERSVAVAKLSADAAKLSADAAMESNRQGAEFFKAEKRPWIGMIGTLSLLEKKSTKPGQYQFTVGYTLKNFGSAPALNTVVPLGPIVEDVNNYNLVKEKVAEARQSGEKIVSMTGDLLLPGAEKYGTCLFGGGAASKIVIPGCVVYRGTDGIVHHTELSYWIDFAEGEKAAFHTAWFQSAD